MIFKNNAPFINYVSKINREKIDKAEDLDVAMPMYNLLEYRNNYRKNNRVVCGIITEMSKTVM